MSILRPPKPRQDNRVDVEAKSVAKSSSIAKIPLALNVTEMIKATRERVRTSKLLRSESERSIHRAIRIIERHCSRWRE